MKLLHYPYHLLVVYCTFYCEDALTSSVTVIGTKIGVGCTKATYKVIDIFQSPI